MKRRGRALKRRYGRAEGERKTVRVLASRVLVNDAPGATKVSSSPVIASRSAAWLRTKTTSSRIAQRSLVGFGSISGLSRRCRCIH